MGWIAAAPPGTQIAAVKGLTFRIAGVLLLGPGQVPCFFGRGRGGGGNMAASSKRVALSVKGPQSRVKKKHTPALSFVEADA